MLCLLTSSRLIKDPIGRGVVTWRSSSSENTQTPIAKLLDGLILRVMLNIALAAACTLAVGGSPQQRANAVEITAKEGPALKRALMGLAQIAYAKKPNQFVLLPAAGKSAQSVARMLAKKGFLTSVLTDSRLNQLSIPKGMPGYKEAHEEWVRNRAYPYLLPDPLQPIRAQQARDRLTPWVPNRLQGNGPSGTWSLMGPLNMPAPYSMYFGSNPITGRVNDCAWHPTNSGVMYISTAAGGVWKTTNTGANWTFMSQQWSQLFTSAVAVSPSNGNVVYAGTGDYPGDQRALTQAGIGVYKSIDGGVTWALKGASVLQGHIISDIWIDPTDTRNVVITTNDAGGVFRSTDGGENWMRRTTLGTNFTGLSYSANRASTGRGWLYAASRGEGGGALIRSGDGGASWTPLPVPTAAQQWSLSIAASKAFPDVVYLLSSGDNRVYKSTTAGGGWSNTTNNFPHGGDNYNWSQSGYDWFLDTSTKMVDNQVRDVIYAGLIDIAKSTDGGANWESIGGPTYNLLSSRTHNDQHAVTVNPSNRDQVLFGNDGGVYRYIESTNSMSNLNRTLSITQFYRADWHNTIANFAIGGTQDNSSPWLDNGVWKNVVGGDGGGAWVDPRGTNVMFASSQGGVFAKTDTTWTFSGGLSMPSTWGMSDRTFTPLIEPDPSNPERLYTADTFLYKIDNWFWGGGTRLNGPGTPNRILCIKVANNDSARIYTGSAGQVNMTRDGGTTWTNITSGSTSLPDRTVMDISVHPSNRNDIVVVLGGAPFGAHVWRCSNTIATTRVWRNVSGTVPNAFPDVQTNCIERDIDDPLNTWYVGTDIGVFMTANGGLSWHNASGPLGLPNVPVTDMEAVAATRFLNIATFGRGMWRIPLVAPPNLTIDDLTVLPSTNWEGRTSQATITLSGPAPFPGREVVLSTTGPVSAPTRLWFDTGESSKNATVRFLTVSAATPATLTATLGVSFRQADLSARPSYITGLRFYSNFVYGGYLTTGLIIFSGISNSDQQIDLSSLSPNAKLALKVTLPKGRDRVEFPVSTTPVAKDEAIIIEAFHNQDKVVGTFSLRSPQVALISASNSKFVIGEKGSLTVWLTSPAPVGGTVVTLTQKPLGVLTMAATVTVPEGANEVNVPFTTKKAASPITVSATTTRDVRSVAFTVNP